MDEKSEFSQWLKDFRSYMQPAVQVSKLSYNADFLESLEKGLFACKALSADQPESVFGALLRRGSDLLQRAQLTRREAFGSIVVELVRGLKLESVPVREMNNSWRIGVLKDSPSAWWQEGILDLKCNGELSRASVLYNQQPLLPEMGIRSAADFRLLLENSYKAIADSRFEDSLLVDLFEQAMDRCSKFSNTSLIPILDFFVEIACCLTRQRYQGKKGQLGQSAERFDKLQFAINADRYRVLCSGMPLESRVLFETGGQSTIQKGAAVTLSALDCQEHRVFSFVSRGRR